MRFRVKISQSILSTGFSQKNIITVLVTKPSTFIQHIEDF